MNFDFTYMLGVIPQILGYLPVTLLISFFSILLATAIGIIFALLLRAGKIPAGFAHLYISFFRGTPVLVQLLIIYFGLPQLFPAINSMSALNAVILGLSLNTSAYLAEIFRAAIDSVDKGQLEASLASGLSMFRASGRIIFPQACRKQVALPFRNDARGEALKKKVDVALEELRADGTLKTISEKWFDTDLSMKTGMVGVSQRKN